MKQLLYKLKWLGVLDSPFKLPRLRFYFGKIRHGTPYFLPRKWVPYTFQDAMKATFEHFNKMKEVHERLGREYKVPTAADYHQKTKEYLRYKKAVDKKFGFDIVPLGYKSKFNEWRHEFNPMFSFVAFNRQFCVFVKGSDDSLTNDCYWEAWLYYRYDTDREKSKRERLEQVFGLYSATWGNDNKGYTDYYLDILRKRYKKQRL